MVTPAKRERARRPRSRHPGDLRDLLRWLRAVRLAEGGEPSWLESVSGRELGAIRTVANRIGGAGYAVAFREYWGRAPH